MFDLNELLPAKDNFELAHLTPVDSGSELVGLLLNFAIEAGNPLVEGSL